MNRTKIEWVRNPDGNQGYSWNPITGCLNHVNGMCKGGNFPCYAYRLAQGRLRERYLAQRNTGLNFAQGADPFYPRFWPKRLSIPEPPMFREYSQEVRFALHQKYRKGIFVCDMSDLFGIGISESWTATVMSEVRMHPEHRFYLLTKQPQNLIKFSPFPDNCWIGVTATNYRMAENALHYLFDIEAKVKYISFEPLLESIAHFPPAGLPCEWERLDWVVIGAQTPYSKKTFPKWEWIKDIIDACDKAMVPLFLKNNLRLEKVSEAGAIPFYKKDPTGTMELRQEIPNTDDVATKVPL